MEGILKKHAAVFEPGLGTAKAKLYPKKDAKPIFCRPRQVPYAIRQKVEQKIERQVAEGIIEPVQFSEWATPVVPVLKKNGSIRLCGDYKATVNRATETDTYMYPLPIIDEMFTSVSGGKVFTKLDLAHAYQQVELDEESQKMVTITTQRGLYKVKRLPFGVASAPSMFQRIMERLLQGIPGVTVFIDDILISGVNEEDNLDKLDQVLTRLEKADMRLKRVKCSHLLPSVDYLGYLISGAGIQPNSEKWKLCTRPLLRLTCPNSNPF